MGNEELTIAASRKEAVEQGLRFYMGATCSTHPTAARYLANGRCVECCRDERRQGKEANREKDAARKRLARQRAKEELGQVSPAASLVLQLICE